MSDKDLTNQNNNPEENKEILNFGEEEKLKPIKQTSSLKGKSKLKKDKEKGQSKFAVKINAPEKPSHKNEDQNNEEFKERRKRRTQFKTVKEPTELKNRDILNLKINDKDSKNGENEENTSEEKKIIRKGKRSTTLIEKDRKSVV